MKLLYIRSKFNIIGLISCLLMMVGYLCSCHMSSPKEEQCIGLNAKEFRAKINEGQWTVIDLRTSQEIAGGMMDGALHLDFHSDTFAEELASLDQEKSYAIYCASGIRSGKTLDQMCSMGFTNVIELKEGYGSYVNLQPN